MNDQYIYYTEEDFKKFSYLQAREHELKAQEALLRVNQESFDVQTQTILVELENQQALQQAIQNGSQTRQVVLGLVLHGVVFFTVQFVFMQVVGPAIVPTLWDRLPWLKGNAVSVQNAAFVAAQETAVQAAQAAAQKNSLPQLCKTCLGLFVNFIMMPFLASKVLPTTPTFTNPVFLENPHVYINPVRRPFE